MKKRFKKLIDLTDVIVFSGTLLLSYGCWMIYEPAAFISSGLILLIIGYKGIS